MNQKSQAESYWRTNLRVIAVLLSIWATISLGCSVFFVELLNQFRLFDLPLGFWIANQGSIYLFVLLILVYAVLMDRIDRKYKSHQEPGSK